MLLSTTAEGVKSATDLVAVEDGRLAYARCAIAHGMIIWAPEVNTRSITPHGGVRVHHGKYYQVIAGFSVRGTPDQYPVSWRLINKIGELI